MLRSRRSEAPGRRRGRLFRAACLAAGAAAAAAMALSAPAQASTGIGRDTFNLPSITEAGGAEYMAYADESAAGEIHVLLLNSGLNGTTASWYDSASSTAPGTGPSIASVSGLAVVVAWTDGATGDIEIAWVTSDGFECVTDLADDLQDPTTNTPKGVSDATPYLTTEGANGAGDLLLAWVDAAGNHLHISQINPPTSKSCPNNPYGFGVASGVTVNDTADTSWGGPALVTSGYSGHSDMSGERVWLMWPGTDSGHHLNIASYTAGLDAFGNIALNQASRTTQASYGTKTDVAGAYNSSTGDVWLTYCGTNNVAYYQEFSPGNVGGSTQNSTGEACNINTFTTGGITYYSGGVGVSYDYSHRYTVLTWAENTSTEIQTEVH